MMKIDNFTGLLFEAIRSNWKNPAFSDYQGRQWSYREVADRILFIHDLFQRFKIRPGDKVTLLGRNSAAWALVYLATVTHGAVIVPILPDFHTNDYHHIVNHSGSTLLFISPGIMERIDTDKMPDLKGILSLSDFSLLSGSRSMVRDHEKSKEKYLDPLEGDLLPDKFDPETIPGKHPAAILYTSGTSGFSKGVMLPHRSLAANVTYAREHMQLTPGDTILSFLPLAHAFGCAFEFLFPFSRGCHITFLSKLPSPKTLLQALAQVRPRLILSVPLVIEKIYRNRIKPRLQQGPARAITRIPGLKKLIYRKIRRTLMDAFGGNITEVVIGGAALNGEVEDFLKTIHFPFTVGYGMTECGPLISYIPSDLHRKHSVGHVIDCLEIKIDSLRNHQDGNAGEILVRGENVMTGYYRNPEATRTALDSEGWLHTGDIGYMDEDGFIYISGRRNSMLLGPSGQNIYPESVEARFNNLPLVSETLVIMKERQLVALVYPDLEGVDRAGLSEEQLNETMEENRRIVNRMLPSYSRIHRVELFPEEFEKTPTRKIKRFLYTIPHSS